MKTNIKKLNEDFKEDIENSSKVFLIGHNEPDFDSIGSCMGLATVVSFFGKEAYIIVNDNPIKLEPGVKKIIDENIDSFNFINNEKFIELADSNSLVIISDTNKDYLVSIANYLHLVKSPIIIDHHEEDSHTIVTDKKIIMTDLSSASELVTLILNYYKVKYSSDVANYLLAGISLDTKRFKQNTSSQTHDVAEKLMDHGADIDYVNTLFLEDMDAYLRINSLILNGTLIKKYTESISPIQISFTLNRNNPRELYFKEDCAKAADRMLKFSGIDASFALGYVDDDYVHISARGGKRVNVGKVMETINGGGTPQSAGGRVKTDDILKLEKDLTYAAKIGLPEEEIILEEPQVIKGLRLKRYKK